MPVIQSLIRQVDSQLLQSITEAIANSKKPSFAIHTEDYASPPGMSFHHNTYLGCNILEHKVSIGYTKSDTSKVVTINIGFYTTPDAFKHWILRNESAQPTEDDYTFLGYSVDLDNPQYRNGKIRTLATAIVAFLQNGFLPQ